MDDHLLGIGTLRTDVAVLARPQDTGPLRGRLDRALSARLPPLLAELAGPVLDGHHGVLRLRRLALHIEHAGAFDEVVLARLIAARLAVALRAALAAGPGAELRHWPDRGSYLAAYVETRLGLDTGPLWPFAEFGALARLSPAEATVALVRSRPALLAELGRAGARAGDPARLLSRLDDHACAAVLAAAGQPAPADPPTAAELTRLGALPDPPAAGTGPDPATPARRALALLLRAAAAEPAPWATPPVPAALALTALAELRAARAGRGLRAAELVPELADGEPPLPDRFRSALRAALAAPRSRAVLAELVGPGAPETPNPRRVTTTPRGPASPVAGVALLLPGVAQHRAHELLTPAQLRAAVCSTLGQGALAGAATDPVLAALLPADPRAEVGEPPLVPPAALARLDPQVGGLITGRAGPEGWGDLLLATFAGRLPGLRGSSRGYLQRQFLHVPGRVEINDELVGVTLDGPPLAVVLAMAGFDGAQAALPHLADRLLVLTLTGLRG